ncbi:MAG: AI-2E family transporter [Rikenellaceae bacterium]
MTPTPQPYTFDRVIRIILTAAGIVGAFYVLNLLKGALLPFVVAWLLAYLINPIVLFCQGRLKIKNRLLAIITTLATILSVITIAVVILAPSISSEFEKTTEVIKDLSQSAQTAPIAEQAWYQSLLEKLNIDEISKLMDPQEWAKVLENSLSYIWAVLSGSVNQILAIVGWLIVLLYLVFILLDYDKIIEGAKQLIPQQYREITLSILSDVEAGMNRYFRGQSLIALSVGVLFSIGFVIIGLPLAIPLGLFIGMLNLVPYLQIVGIIPTALLCLLGTYDSGESFWSLFGLSMVVFAVVQTIQDLYITPKIMGHATGLNPAVILLSLSIWGSLMGVMGMIIALPLTSLLLAYYKKYILRDSDPAIVELSGEGAEKEPNKESEQRESK